MIQFKMLHPRMTEEHLGFLPDFLSEHDPRPAREQIDANYRHGGGWNPMLDWQLLPNNSIRYPGDPALAPLASAKLHDEELFFYNHAWLCIKQPDGSYEVSRVD